MPATPTFSDENTLQIGETEFHFEYPLKHVPPGQFGIEKPRALLQAYMDLWHQLRPRRVVELGIRRGGSAAMLYELGGLERLVSIEIAADRVDELDQFISERALERILRPWYGIDQGDQDRLRQIMSLEFGDSDLDLVVDDASHLYGPSRASFEVLFPRLRPAGVYLIEDWSWQHMLGVGFGDRLAAVIETDPAARRRLEEAMIAQGSQVPEPPMSRLAMELVIARAISGDAVESLTFGREWVVVRRGPAPLDPETFSLDRYAPDDLGLLATKPSTGG